MKYSGIDLHGTNNVLVVTDEQDRVLYRKRLPNRLEEVLAALAPHRDELAGVVVESTYNWYWLVDGLQEQGYTVHLANTGAIRQYDGLKHGGDESDATYLAHLLRLGILPTGYILPKDARAARDLSRKRMQLVQSRTAHVLAVENLFARNTGARPSSGIVKGFTPADIDRYGFDEDLALAIKANVAVIGALNGEIERLEQRLRANVALKPDFALLKTAPGIGDILATTIMLETGTVNRFPTVGDYSSYCRCVDSARISNGKKKGGGNTKNGNKYLAWAYVEAAHYAARYSPEAKRFYERKKNKVNRIVATKALAHKLARACYHMLRDHQPFDMKRCFA